MELMSNANVILAPSAIDSLTKDDSIYKNDVIYIHICNFTYRCENL